MGLKKLAAKVAEYNARLEGGKASKIKPNHVKKVLEKLRAKQVDLESDLAEAKHHDKKVRLKRKLGIVQEHIARAEWLLQQID